MIFTLDARSNVLLPVIKSALTLSEAEIFDTINDQFLLLINELEQKSVN
jgi:hypothetical protein